MSQLQVKCETAKSKQKTIRADKVPSGMIVRNNDPENGEGELLIKLGPDAQEAFQESQFLWDDDQPTGKDVAFYRLGDNTLEVVDPTTLLTPVLSARLYIKELL